MHRQAAVAGTFYPAKAEAVTQFIKRHEISDKKERVISALVPHAGYVYSGSLAVKTLSRLKIPKKVILAGPNHTGAGKRVSLYPKGSWQTPYGVVQISTELVDKLSGYDIFEEDADAHFSEHSLEVMLPILKYLRDDVEVLCITMKYISPDEIVEVAKALDEACDEDVLFLISSDFNHFEDEVTTKEKDSAAIERLLEIDEAGLYSVVRDMEISMCGVIPACVGMVFSKLRGASKSVLIEHTHSGKVNGDNERVVGYAGLLYK